MKKLCLLKVENLHMYLYIHVCMDICDIYLSVCVCVCVSNLSYFIVLKFRFALLSFQIDNSYMDKGEHGSSSESEDEALGKYHEALSRTHTSRLPLADSRQKNYAWETRQKYSPLSAEYDGYSSEASIDEGNTDDLFYFFRSHTIVLDYLYPKF